VRGGGLPANQGIAGFKPLRKDARQVLKTLRTGDGRALSPHLRTVIGRILRRLELLSEQIKAAEAISKAGNWRLCTTLIELAWA
jgi:transposase